MPQPSSAHIAHPPTGGVEGMVLMARARRRTWNRGVLQAAAATHVRYESSQQYSADGADLSTSLLHLCPKKYLPSSS